MPETLRSLFPTAKDLLAVEPEALAPALLRLARDHRQGPFAMFEPISLTGETTHILTSNPDPYPFHEKRAVEAHINETLNLLRTSGLIGPAPDINGRNGWLVLTKAGEEASASTTAYERVRAAKDFPKSLLHPAIADAAWSALMRNDLDDAVFKSFKAVEEAVRSAGGYAAEDIGVDLMRKAFHPAKGPLKKSQTPSPNEKLSARYLRGR